MSFNHFTQNPIYFIHRIRWCITNEFQCKMYLPGLIYGKDLAIEDAIDDEYEKQYSEYIL